MGAAPDPVLVHRSQLVSDIQYFAWGKAAIKRIQSCLIDHLTAILRHDQPRIGSNSIGRASATPRRKCDPEPVLCDRITFGSRLFVQGRGSLVIPQEAIALAVAVGELRLRTDIASFRALP